jgi:hypothetical protein
VTKRPTALKDLMKNPAPNSPSQVGIISDAIMGSLLRRTGFVIYSTIVGILLMRTSVISGVTIITWNELKGMSSFVDSRYIYP